MLYRKVATALIIIYHSFTCHAQEANISPELQQMRANAREYMARGNYKDAITTYKQLTAIRKNDYNLVAELARAYAKNGEIKQATELFRKVGDGEEMTDTAYCIVSQIYLEAHELRNANKWANWGLKKYPNSGILYEQHGLVLYNGDNNDALKEWMTGMEKAPGYAGNYKQAATATANSGYLWPVIWGETYLYMAHDTSGDATFKEMLLQCWKNYFEQVTEEPNPKYAFEQYGNTELLQLTPVVSDGINVESLTMIKTRYMLQPIATTQYHISLWDHYNEMLRSGWFDVYNEWLYGQACSNNQFVAWNKFHAGDIDKFLDWKKTHPIRIVPSGITPDVVSNDLIYRWLRKKKR
jgi:hypothetical protein